jgi:hypothetical protein
VSVPGQARRKQRQQATIARRREQVARLRLQGLGFPTIAEQLGCGIGTVYRDFEAMLAEWRASHERDTDAKVQQILAEIQLMRAEAWAAWERSKQPREVTTTERTQGGEGGDRLKAGVRKEGRDPASEYMRTVEWCIEKECEIWGLNAPKKVAMTDPSGKKPAPPPAVIVIDPAALSDDKLKLFDELCDAALGQAAQRADG